MESKGWADLPPDLLLMIHCLLHDIIDILRFRGVCRSWRSSVVLLNKHVLSPFFPRALQRNSCPQYLVANAVFHLRSIKAPTSYWIVSVQESKPGKLLLRDALTSKPIPGSSGCRLDLSGCRLTQISISHSILTPTIDSPHESKAVLVDDDNSEPMAVFKYNGLCAIRRCLSPHGGQLVALRGIPFTSKVYDFVNFNGCIYAVDAQPVVYILDRDCLRLLPLTCVEWSHWATTGFGKRFVVSDGDLYLVFNWCTINPDYHEYYIYKLVMDDIDPTRYKLEKVKNLGDRVFIVNKDCSFSVSARDFPPPLVGNCVIVSRYAFANCCCSSDFRIYHLGGRPARMVRPLYPALFKPPRFSSEHQLQSVAPQRKRRRAS